MSKVVVEGESVIMTKILNTKFLPEAAMGVPSPNGRCCFLITSDGRTPSPDDDGLIQGTWDSSPRVETFQ